MQAVRVDPNDLARPEFANIFRADGREGARFGSEHVAAARKTAVAQWPHAPRIAKRVERFRRRHDDRIRAFGARHHVADPRDHVGARGLHDRFREHFGIRRRLQHRRREQTFAQVVRIRQVSVVRERDLTEVRVLEQRLCVDDDRGAGRRIPRVTDRDVPGEPAEHVFIEDARDQTHLAMTHDRGAVRYRDAGRFLTAMLQRVQPEIRVPRDFVSGGVDADDPARFVHRVAGRHRSLAVVIASHQP